MTATHSGRIARSVPCKRTPKSGADVPNSSRKARTRAKLHVPRAMRAKSKSQGNAIVEVVAALLALTPFLIGIPLIGKQFDVKHKTLDAARYAVWERTVWRNENLVNRKNEWDVMLEIRDRTFGSPIAGLVSQENLRASGVTENQFWVDTHGEPLLAYRDGQSPIAIEQKTLVAPRDVGHLLVPSVAHGGGTSRVVPTALGVADLRLARETFSQVSVVASMRNISAERVKEEGNSGTEASRLIVQEATAAILSDTWSPHDESTMRRGVDDLTTDELIESLEFPGRPIAVQASGKGLPMYGEGQFATEVDLRPASNALPNVYVRRK